MLLVAKCLEDHWLQAGRHKCSEGSKTPTFACSSGLSLAWSLWKERAQTPLCQSFRAVSVLLLSSFVSSPDPNWGDCASGCAEVMMSSSLA